MQRSDREVGREDGLDRWGEWIGGEVSVWIGGVKRSTGSGKLTVSLCLARWSDWLDRWLTGWAGSGALVWIGVSLSSHSPWVCVICLGDRTTMRDRWSSGWARRDRREVAGSEGVLSFFLSLVGWIRALILSLALSLSFAFFLSLSLSFAWPENGLKWKWKCKIIFGSKE